MEGGLRYPILLVHGLGARDRKHLCYWGRIPARLEAEGARIYYGDQDSHGSIESNGAALRDRAIRILEETGVEKLHVLAHSKGGLDARYMASLPGMAPRIASLTTVCTPHNGSVTVDRLLRLPDGLVRLVSFFCNLWFRILGDKQPDSYRVFHQLTTSEAAAFNASHPIPSGVRCRSYAFAMSRACSDLILCPIRWSKLWREKTTGWLPLSPPAGRSFRARFVAVAGGASPIATRWICAAVLC